MKHEIIFDPEGNTKIQDKMFVVFVSLTLLFISACDSTHTYTYTLNLNSRLADGKKILLAYEIDFDNKSSLKKMENDIDKIRYALTMVFSQVNSKEIENNHEMRSENALSIILKKYFTDEFRAVRITDFKIQENG